MPLFANRSRHMVGIRARLRICVLGVSGALFLAALSLAGSTSTATPLAQTPVSSPTPFGLPPPPGPILLTSPITDTKQPGVLFFAATGHTLRGKFLAYWQAHGGLSQFGYPLTEEFFEGSGPDPTDTRLQVQYFQRNRFELHLEYAGTPSEVLLGTLGREFHAQDAPAVQLPSPSLYFTETGHNLSGKFLLYWQTHGGLAVQGYPLTEELQEESPTNHKMYTVQYFERSRMELHPENAGTTYEVLLGLLGTQSVQKKGYFSGLYPAYGYAADYSWVSGRVTMYRSIVFTGSASGCSILQYGTKEQRVQLNTPDGGYYGLPHWSVGANAVVVGRLIGPEEPPAAICLDDAEAPVYNVEHHIQYNPVP